MRELVEVDYDVLPAVVNVGRCCIGRGGRCGGATTLRKTTIASSGPLATRAVWTQRLPMRRMSPKLDLVSNRLIPNAMGRAHYRPASRTGPAGKDTLYVSKPESALSGFLR